MKIGKLGIKLGIIISLILISFTSNRILAQKNYPGTITGTVVDNSGALPGAIVRVLKSKDSTLVNGASVGDDGNFSIGVPYGSYKINISYTGYKNYFKDGISVTSSNPTVSLGKITLSTGEVLTEEIEVEARSRKLKLRPRKKL